MPLTHKTYSFYLNDFLAMHRIIYHHICIDLKENDVLMSKLNTIANVLACHNKMTKLTVLKQRKCTIIFLPGC